MEMHTRRIITIGIIFSLALSVVSCALGEQAPWDCPECGRKGNTGNYCGWCAHPAPWIEKTTGSDSTAAKTVSDPVVIPVSISTPVPTPKLAPTPAPTVKPLSNAEATTEIAEGVIKLHVSWEGGVFPYYVRMYQYIDEEHSYRSKDDYIAMKETYTRIQGTSVYLDEYLSPGQTYWIRITDKNKQDLWLKYTFPQIALEGASLDIEYVYFESTDRKKTTKNKLSKYVLDEYEGSYVRLKGNHSDLYPDNEKESPWVYTLVQPDARVLLVGTLNYAWNENSTQTSREFKINVFRNPKNHIRWPNYPTGKYTLIISYKNYHVCSREIIITD